MRLHNSSNTIGRTTSRLWKRSLWFVLCLIWAFPLASSAFAANTENSLPTQNAYSDRTDVLSVGLFDAATYHPAATSFPDKTPLEKPEETNNTEKEDVDDSDGHSLGDFAFQSTSLTHRQIGQLARCVLNRTEVPFYILFHAWKSYLA